MLERISKVTSYEVEPIRIPYEYQDLIKNTVPDLLVTYDDGAKELIEIKPEAFLNGNLTRAKTEAMSGWAMENDITFSIWTEKDLGLSR